jgi:hypothetical protein
MAYQPIDLGTRGNNQTGDDINEAGVKINANFSELYTTKLESVVGGASITIDNTDPLNPIINGSSTITTTSDLINDGADGQSTYVEADDLGNLAALNEVSTSQILNGAVTLPKLSNANALSILGNASTSSAIPQYLTSTQVRTILNVQDGAAPNQSLSIVGNDLTISGGNTVTLPSAGSVTVDTSITDGSSNPVTNNAIHDALVNINAFVAAGNIQSDKIQDGPGSGLDADTVDGVQLSNLARTDIAETFNGAITLDSGAFTPLAILGDGVGIANRMLISIRDSNGTIQGSLGFPSSSNNDFVISNIAGGGTLEIKNGSLFAGANELWHQGNDGPNSGLNADLLDNFHASASNVGNTVALRTAGGDIQVADESYTANWNGSVEVPTKNAVYDKIESLAIPSETNGSSSPTATITSGPWTVSSSIMHWTIKDNTATFNIRFVMNGTWTAVDSASLNVSLPFTLRTGIPTSVISVYAAAGVSSDESVSAYMTGATVYVTYNRSAGGGETWTNNSLVLTGTVLI